MQPHVTPLEDDAGLSLYDPIESARSVLYTDRPVDPRPADEATFPFPVGMAVSVEVSRLAVPKLDVVHVRAPDGTYVDAFEGRVGERYEADGDRLLDFSSTALKLYVAVPGPFEIAGDPGGRETVVTLSAPGEAVVGVRSFHERPGRTVETPAEPEPVVRALSATGSALKTLSPERSFPTLRGHPPVFEPADELSIPDGIEPPDTDVTIWVPPKWEFVYPVSPLVYYLGATVLPGGPPCIQAGNWTFPLGPPDGDPEAFQTQVIRALKQVFFMDCLTRTEGLYPVELRERRALGEDLDLDLAALYDAPLAAQVRAFLDVPYSVVEGHLPSWHLCVDVEPTADHVTALPYLLDDLALIRCPSPREPADPDPEVDQALSEFVRSPERPEDVRSGDRTTDSEEVFMPEPTPAMEHAYMGKGLPLRRNKLTPAALERRLDYDDPPADSITVRIVCNDEMMADEAAVEEYYGVHDLVQYSVDIDYELTRAELAEVLRADVDLLHYVGHIDGRGFTCADEPLDARELDDVGVDMFLLNACDSYAQGRALLDAGAKAGVTSLTEVSNKAATRLGRTMARALNAGFTLRSALSLTAIDSAAVYYIVLGDGGRQLVQCPSGVPILADVVDADLDAEVSTVDLFAFPGTNFGQGTFTKPALGDPGHHCLLFGPLDRFTCSVDDVGRYFSTQSMPVTVDGKLHWSDEVDSGRLESLLSKIEELRAVDRTRRRIVDFFRPLRVEQ
ncbi:hypothetical protein BRC81_10655 [Halobacteriales archaeon QS_1_68_20]|nr:MAG: hypothetical protein BRC81_10655 [Halobacteriales archaeon QS_1_68_20]